MATRPRPGVTAGAVVDAAAMIADAAGLEGLTLAGVAAAVGVRTPSLYAHVDGLQDVRRRLGTHGATDLGEILSRAAITAAARVVDILRALLHGYGLDGDDAVHAIRAVRCAMHGFVALEDAGGFGIGRTPFFGPPAVRAGWM